jgi:hypothetical protein
VPSNAIWQPAPTTCPGFRIRARSGDDAPGRELDCAPCRRKSQAWPRVAPMLRRSCGYYLGGRT